MVAGSRRADVEILLRVSRMYYEQGLMQSEIAARIGYSRPHVSRLLAQARERRVLLLYNSPSPRYPNTSRIP